MSVLQLATWIRLREGESLTHLKLQKLVFYTYGAALAFDRDAEIGPVEFEAWDHGPVNRDVWNEFRGYGRECIPEPASSELRVRYSSELSEVLEDALAVYSQLDAWSLRQQSHLEKPWIDAYANGRGPIDSVSLRRHFQGKFCGSSVALPEYWLNVTTTTLDGIPAATFDSFHALADAARSVQSQ